MHVVLCTALISNSYITHYFFFPAPTLAFAFPRTFFCLFLRSFRCFLVAFGFSYKPSCSTSTHISVHTHITNTNNTTQNLCTLNGLVCRYVVMHTQPHTHLCAGTASYVVLAHVLELQLVYASTKIHRCHTNCLASTTLHDLVHYDPPTTRSLNNSLLPSPLPRSPVPVCTLAQTSLGSQQSHR